MYQVQIYFVRKFGANILQHPLSKLFNNISGRAARDFLVKSKFASYVLIIVI